MNNSNNNTSKLAPWQAGWRDQTIQALIDGKEKDWDLVVVGGGITGAGVFREATRRNLKVLLIEQKDFAWGTSSKSSKMVHGGLRYLGSGQIGLTYDSVKERQRLMNEAPGLVEPLHFLMGHYRFAFPGPAIFNILLTFYDWMARKWNHRFHRRKDTPFYAPGIRSEKLDGATQFGDAVTDDARLVLRVLREGLNEGGVALNYVSAERVASLEEGIKEVTLKDDETQQSFTIRAKAVVNATGAWTDELRQSLGKEGVIRPLRGSHLVFPQWRLPVSFAVSFFHPKDKRPVFLFPWEGVSVAGTTDLDHKLNKGEDIAIKPEEVDYLIEALNHHFPAARVSANDAIASYAGVRPVVGTGALNPSSEKREHSIWDDEGLVSVAGGKLTTFRLIALDVLAAVQKYLPGFKLDKDDGVIFKTQTTRAIPPGMSKPCFTRLAGRYGEKLGPLLDQAESNIEDRIRNTDTLWMELEWALSNEAVVHLDDLLLRRTRIGLLLAHGGNEVMDRVKSICLSRLSWDEVRWQQEYDRYQLLWRQYFSVPGQETTNALNVSGQSLSNDAASASNTKQTETVTL